MLYAAGQPGGKFILLVERRPPAASLGLFKRTVEKLLRQSGQIKQDADGVLLLYKEEPNNPKSCRCLKIPKTRRNRRTGLSTWPLTGRGSALPRRKKGRGRGTQTYTKGGLPAQVETAKLKKGGMA